MLIPSTGGCDLEERMLGETPSSAVKLDYAAPSPKERRVGLYVAIAFAGVSLLILLSNLLNWGGPDIQRISIGSPRRTFVGSVRRSAICYNDNNGQPGTPPISRRCCCQEVYSRQVACLSPRQATPTLMADHAGRRGTTSRPVDIFRTSISAANGEPPNDRQPASTVIAYGQLGNHADSREQCPLIHGEDSVVSSLRLPRDQNDGGKAQVNNRTTTFVITS